ncbi:MAG: glycosyltransferase [Nigerium sp.]|nr:glycosyltransferase [Nigerium sp.]
MAEPARFSVLLPVYAGDTASFFSRAIASVTADQTLRPDELVIVVDGPVGAATREVLDAAGAGRITAGVPVTIVALPENVGLARALNRGLDACAHPVVARADADDISLPHRFERQVPLVAHGGIDLVSSAITEFHDDEAEPGLVRAYPTDHDAISALARFRDPFNHPAVVYRRDSIDAAGGYRHLDKMEDYWLFVRMINAGATVANVAEPLVLYRVGAGAYERRGGWTLLRSELKLQRWMRQIGFTTTRQWARNIAVRGGWRVVPTSLRRRVYGLAARTRDPQRAPRK